MSPPEKERHNVRKPRGKRRGQFVKKKELIRTNNVVKSIRERVFKKNENSKAPQASRNRIVDLTLLADQLSCKTCNIPLLLEHIIHESRQGLASILTIPCSQCKRPYKVITSERENDSKNRFKMNTRAPFAILDGGIGETHLNTVISAFDVGTLTPNLLKRHERYVGKVIETVAKESCSASIELEKKLTVEREKMTANVYMSMNLDNECDKTETESSGTTHDGAITNSEPNLTVDSSVSEVSAIQNEFRRSDTVDIKAGFDCGWQKRGTGHAYNSLSGHGTLIGHYSGKILSYAVRNADCRMCKLGHDKNDHDCRQNFTGTAKAMEPDMAVELIVNNTLLKEKNVRVKKLISDDDSSTPAAVRRSSSYEIEKWSDYNHTVKSFTSALYAMKFSRTLIEYFSHCFSHAIKQNKGNSEAVKRALESIVPHAFGEHTTCGDWCKTDAEGKYVHKHLPNGKPLEDPHLRLSLTKIISRYVNNADKIAPCGSTQANESMNNIVAQKCIKSRHYAGSESLNFRVAAAVCQKNLGHKYIENVYDKLKLPLTQGTIKFRNQRDIKRERRALRSKEVVDKKQRLDLKKNRSSKNAAGRKKEGFTYESRMNLDSISELIPNINIINEPHDISTCKVVLFDLETTGLSRNDEICQIAAFTKESSFNIYIIPSKSISKGASTVTGLRILNGELYLRENPVHAVSASQAFQQFLQYLASFERSIILAAHNGFTFDIPRIMKLAFDLELIDRFKSLVVGFADSLHITRKLLSERRKSKLKFSVEALATDFLPNENLKSLHNATDDVIILDKILDAVNITDDIIKENSITTLQLLQQERNKTTVLTNKDSFKEFKENISASMINKMAKAGLNKLMLQQAFEKGGVESIRTTLGESVNGKARVTTNKKVVNNICKLFINLPK